AGMVARSAELALTRAEGVSGRVVVKSKAPTAPPPTTASQVPADTRPQGDHDTPSPQPEEDIRATTPNIPSAIHRAAPKLPRPSGPRTQPNTPTALANRRTQTDAAEDELLSGGQDAIITAEHDTFDQEAVEQGGGSTMLLTALPRAEGALNRTQEVELNLPPAHSDVPVTSDAASKPTADGHTDTNTDRIAEQPATPPDQDDNNPSSTPPHMDPVEPPIRPAVQAAREAKASPDVVPERGWTMTSLTAIPSGGSPASQKSTTTTPLKRRHVRTQRMPAITYRSVEPTSETPPTDNTTPPPGHIDPSIHPTAPSSASTSTPPYAVGQRDETSPDTVPERGWTMTSLAAIPSAEISAPQQRPQAPDQPLPESGWSSIALPSLEEPIPSDSTPTTPPADAALPESGWSSIALPSLEEPDDNR
ncbi:MAG: hypothetical protein AAFX99_08485, partial [Myxococcota bacterium]